MKYRYLLLILAFAAAQAMATRVCEPKTPREPPVSKPEPKAEPRQAQREPGGKPCDGISTPFWCPKAK